LGTWLGLAYVPFVILIGSITGLIVGLIAMRTSKEGFKTAIPFGPFLALGAYTAWVLKSLGLWG
jgi:leader peptidase (prepilin peptidase)/N-methyltransferase